MLGSQVTIVFCLCMYFIILIELSFSYNSGYSLNKVNANCLSIANYTETTASSNFVQTFLNNLNLTSKLGHKK